MWWSNRRDQLLLQRGVRTEIKCPLFARQNQGVQSGSPLCSAILELHLNQALVTGSPLPSTSRACLWERMKKLCLFVLFLLVLFLKHSFILPEFGGVENVFRENTVSVQ